MKGYWIVVPGAGRVNGSDVKTVCCLHISSIGPAKAAAATQPKLKRPRLRLCRAMRFEADGSCNELSCCHWVWQDLAPVLLARGPSRPAMIGWRSALSPGRVVPPPDGPTDWRSSSLGCQGFQEVTESMRFGQAVEMPLIRSRCRSDRALYDFMEIGLGIDYARAESLGARKARWASHGSTARRTTSGASSSWAFPRPPSPSSRACPVRPSTAS